MRLDGEPEEVKPRAKIPEDILRRKKDIYMAIQDALNKTGKSIKGVFARVDSD